MDSALQRERFVDRHERCGLARGEALAPVLRRAQAGRVFRAKKGRDHLPGTIDLLHRHGAALATWC